MTVPPVTRRTRLTRRAVAVLGLVTLAAGPLTACSTEPAAALRPQSGTATAAPGPDGVQFVTIRATTTFRFVPSTVYAAPGKIRITLENPRDATTNSLAFRAGGPTQTIPVLAPGQSASITVEVDAAGTYEFYCPFRDLNQRGTLIVRDA